MFMCVYFFFFKQKTEYAMRISDWSSDVCSSDLPNTISVGARRAIGSVIETGFGGWMMTVFGTPLSAGAKRVLLLGSGELGKEVVIELQRYGVETIAVDRYARPEERRVGKECVGTCRYRWSR